MEYTNRLGGHGLSSAMDLYNEILATLRRSPAVVLGTVVEALGSTPQKSGCQAFLTPDGDVRGTLGGGMVEAQAVARMRDALETGIPRLLEMRLDEAYSRDAGPICGGVMRIFVNPRVADHADAVSCAVEAVQRRERGWLMTRLDGSAVGSVAWLPGNNGVHDIGVDAEVLHDIRAKAAPQTVATATGESFFVEPVSPQPRLLVVGGGHVGQAVVEQAVALGFETTVFDDRPEFAAPDRFPSGVTASHGEVRNLVAAYPKDRDTYIVLVSKGHKMDAEALEACIDAEVAYLGMIGSRRKVRMLKENFLDSGIATPEQWDRIVAPIGYELGAVTVPEIAVSIVAQLIAARRRPEAVHAAPVKAH